MMVKASRNTKQKELIKRILCSTKSHPTADWIHEQARKELPNISLGTVYRNLNLMKDAGEILELDYGSTFSRFDGNPEPHYHFRCIACSNVYDVDISIENRLDHVDTPGFKVLGHRLEFTGCCPNCNSKAN